MRAPLYDMPSDVQMQAALLESSDGTLSRRHFTSSGLIINEYRYGEFVGIDRDGNVIEDTHIMDQLEFGNLPDDITELLKALRRGE